MINIENAKRVLAKIKAEPETHSQKQWARRTPCGTTACIAGHAVIEIGCASPIFDYKIFDGSEIAGACQTPDGETHAIFDFAAELLGLEEDVAHDLFYLTNNQEAINELERLIAEAERQA